MWRLFSWSFRFVHWWQTPSFDYVSNQWLREHAGRSQDDDPRAKSSLSEL